MFSSVKSSRSWVQSYDRGVIDIVHLLLAIEELS